MPGNEKFYYEKKTVRHSDGNMLTLMLTSFTLVELVPPLLIRKGPPTNITYTQTREVIFECLKRERLINSKHTHPLLNIYTNANISPTSITCIQTIDVLFERLKLRLVGETTHQYNYILNIQTLESNFSLNCSGI